MWPFTITSRLFAVLLALAAATADAAEYEADVYHVVARRRPRQISEENLNTEESRKVAGAAGDVVRAVAALPGVATANDYLANLMVRGSGMEDNLILLDGFPVSYPFHFGGVESVFHPGMIQSADFLPSGFDVRYGDAQGGVLELQTQKPKAGFGGEASLSMILAGALLKKGSASGDLAALADFRRGYFDLVLDPDLSLTGIPRYQDYAAKLWAKAWGGDLSLNFFGSQDWLKVKNQPSAAALGHESEWESFFHTAGLGWDSGGGGSWWLKARASGTYAGTKVDLGNDLNLDRKPYEWLVSVELGASPAPDHELDFGLAWHQTRTQLEGYFKRVPVELGSDFDFNAAQPVSVTALGSKAVLSAWAQDRWNPLENLWVTLGARYDHVDLSDEFHLSPRASLQWKALPQTTLRGVIGDYFQSPNGMETVPGWTTGFLRSSLTHLVSAALEQDLAASQRLRVEWYHKDFERRLPPYTVSSGSESVVLNAANTGYAEGAELSWRMRPVGGFFAWASYAWNYTLRSSGRGYYEADFSQPHVVNAVANFAFTPALEAGLRYRLASGIPYTPVESVSHDANGYHPIFGATNSRRLDWYQRFDLRAQYSFLYPSWTLRFFTELVNALDWPNVTSVTYEDDYSRIRTVKQFPRFLFAGVEAVF